MFDLVEKYKAINLVKAKFTQELSSSLGLMEVSAPLCFVSNEKINDSLNGECPVKFEAKDIKGEIEIVHSLAKGKRMILKNLGFSPHMGIYSHMKAIRKEETLSHKHSIYIDQGDGEVVIAEKDRNLSYLFDTVKKIGVSLLNTKEILRNLYIFLKVKLPKDLIFISSEALYHLYPKCTPEERERLFAKEKGAFYVYEIGYPLVNGQPHSFRAFDYDDGTLNGDLIVYDSKNDDGLELLSMGIRVDKNALEKQIKSGNKSEKDLGEYHKLIMNQDIPYTIGGGIGQSRVIMYLLEMSSLCEVQSSCGNDKLLADGREKEIDSVY